MTFALTPDQESLVEEARAAARERLVPIARAGPAGRVNRGLVRALGETGLLPRLFPQAAGGSRAGEVSAKELCVVGEALAQESTEAETSLAMQAIGGYPILQSATEATIQRWVPLVARGEAVAAFALTEPEHGTDAAAIELAAEPDGEGYRLTGSKTWITNAPDADVYVVFARTSPRAGAKGVSAFVVPGDAPGLSGEPIDLLSPHPIGTLDFDGVRVPPEALLGGVDQGFRVAMGSLDLFRPSVGAFAVGMARAALDAAVAYAAKRQAFGKPLRELQAVAHLLAEMATRTEAARLMVYAAAAAYDEKRSGVTKKASMAKLFATETAQWVVDRALQIHGAAGLEAGHLLEHLYREVRAPRIYEGTSEIQREVIARELYR